MKEFAAKVGVMVVGGVILYLLIQQYENYLDTKELNTQNE